MMKLIKIRFLLLIFIFISDSVFASNVETIMIKNGEVVSKDVAINPGFAVLFQFSEEVVALTLADQTSFACDKMPSDGAKVLCKPLTQNSYVTNLVVITTSNEFNLVLTVDPSNIKHPFKYLFSDGTISFVKSALPSTNSTRVNTSSNNNLIDVLMDQFASRPCHLKSENSVLKFRCKEFIEIGSDKYVRFSLTGISSSPFKIIKISLNQESLGGLTGLAVKDVNSIEITYALKEDSVSKGEEIMGIVKLPVDGISKDNRTSLNIMTDNNQGGDLKVYGL